MAERTRHTDTTMENSTDMNLEQRITRWRDSLACSPGLREQDVEELETHLRDSMDHLQDSGLSLDEAFLVAVKRTGSTSELDQQYGLANPGRIWLTRATWMLCGILLYWVMGSINGILSSASMLVGSYLSLGAELTAWGGLAVQCVMLGGFVAIALTKAVRRLDMRSQNIATLLGILLVAVPLLVIGEYGAMIIAARSVPVEAVGANAMARMVWNIVLTITILMFGVGILKQQRQRLRED